jgi:hypothetical protein
MKIIGSLVLAALVGLPSVGCMVRGTGHAHISGPTVAVVEVEEEPPPPRVVHFDVRPGFIYIDGRWTRHNNRWVWRDGYYERERRGHVWRPGRWDRRGRRHVWVEGQWQAGGRVEQRGPEVRDHRGPRRDPPPPVVRDHR